MPHARLLLSISFNFKHAHPSTFECAEFHGDIVSKATCRNKRCVPSGPSLSHGVE